MAVQDYKINYKSDFVLTINGDAGWAVPFCIKFWTGMPSQAYFVGFDGVKYVNCRVGDTPTQLLVMFDDHHLPIGPLKMQIAYHTTIEEFPGSVFDEVTNARDVIVTIDGTDYQVMLDFTGEDAPELEFNLPAYANEAERIQNELQRQQNEADRIAAELQREQATAAAVQGAENVNAQLNGTTLTVTNRNGVSTSVNTKGEQGEQGPVGPEGPQGEQGVSIVSFRQVYASETATYYSITFSDGHEQSVAIPKGAKGDTGATGPTGPQGPQGDTGVSITGFVETGETETDTLYNITFSNGTTQQVAIPKGEKGDTGDQGPVGPQGPQGPMGDVAVITPEQQAAFTMYSTTGQNTNGPMTQKAVTDALVAGSISYDNSQSGLATDNVQGALDLVSDGVRKTLITIPSTIHTNGFMKFDGTFVSATGFDCRFTELIPCQEGDKFVWMGAGNGAYSVPTQVTSGNYAISWIFYNSSRSRVSSWSVGLSTQVVTIPSGVAYVQFTGIVKKTSATRPFIVGYNDVQFDADDISKRMIQPILHVGGFLKYDGSWYAAANFDTSYTELIPCQEGDKFIYYGAAVSNTYSTPIQVTSGNYAISWIFYDSNKTRVSSWQLGYRNPYIVEIPSGVSYVKFAGIVRSTNATIPFSIWHDDYIIKSTEIRNENVIPSTIHTDGFMKFDGTFYSATGFNCRFTELIPCQEGDKFVWMGAGNGAYSVPTQVTSGNNAITWIFYNSSRIRVSSWSVGLSTQVVTIPSGVAYVQFTGIVKTTSATRPFSVWKDDYIVSIAEGGSLLEKWKGLKWVAFGDSLTEHNQRATKNYHDYINEWTGISVVNRGVSGSGYKYLYDESKAFYQRIQTQTDEDADVVTIFGSGNDLHLNNGVPIYPLGDIDDTGTETVCGCINTTLDWLQANRPLMPLGIISMTPWRANGGVPAANQDAYVDKLEQICRKRGIPYLDLYHCSNLHPDSSAFKNVAYKRDGTYSASSQGVTGAIQVTADNLSIVRAFGVSNAQIGDWVLPNLTGVHPDEDGQKFFAPRIKAFLEELIEK